MERFSLRFWKEYGIKDLYREEGVKLTSTVKRTIDREKGMERILIEKLKSLSDPRALAGMARFGINLKKTYGVSIPVLRKLAKQVGQNHLLAQKLWNSGIHEARILAGMIDVPEEVTEKQMERWVMDFNSWDVCDQVCSNLFDRTNSAHKKAIGWSKRGEEFVKRAGFVLMAALAVHDKEAGDKEFLKFLPIIKREALDERNFVKKAVNWALRQIGKRNLHLNQVAIQTAKEVQGIDSKSAKWIASDAIRELTSEAVRKRFQHG
jgi:3-methyladenine DNA glycosylase AlkD